MQMDTPVERAIKYNAQNRTSGYSTHWSVSVKKFAAFDRRVLASSSLAGLSNLAGLSSLAGLFSHAGLSSLAGGLVLLDSLVPCLKYHL